MGVKRDKQKPPAVNPNLLAHRSGDFIPLALDDFFVGERTRPVGFPPAETWPVLKQN